jgi:ABC-2 type transport system ATP-binding protein
MAVPPTAGAPVVLRVAGLVRTYGERAAVRDVGFEVRRGERIAVIGPNGAGKTTLLGLMCGALRPTAGRVEHDAGEVGWVPQEPSVYSKLSVGENLRLFARLERVPDVGAAVTRALAQAELADREGDPVHTFSGGLRQRVNIAVGVLADPAVLVLDEPSSALDPAQRARLWELLDRLAGAGTAIVFSTHDAGEAERHADRVLVMDAGSARFLGPPAALHAAVAGDPPDLEAALLAFLGATPDPA